MANIEIETPSGRYKIDFDNDAKLLEMVQLLNTTFVERTGRWLSFEDLTFWVTSTAGIEVRFDDPETLRNFMSREAE